MKRLLWIAIAVIAADQVTKALARGMAAPVTLIPGVLGLRLCENTGAAFSMLSGNTALLGIISLAMVVIGWLVLRRYRLRGLAAVSAMLMLGGALSNAVDRLLFGSVTDMVEVLCFRFAVFNAADAALTVGAVLMAVSLLFIPREWHTKEEKTHE